MSRLGITGGFYFDLSDTVVRIIVSKTSKCNSAISKAITERLLPNAVCHDTFISLIAFNLQL